MFNDKVTGKDQGRLGTLAAYEDILGTKQRKTEEQGRDGALTSEALGEQHI